MNARPAGRWRQLALLTVAVLAVHLLVLRPAPQLLAPAREGAGPKFTMRSVPAPAPEPAIVAAAPAPAPTMPAPASRRAPSRPAPAAAPPAAAAPAQALPASIVALPSAVLHYELSVRSRGVTLSGRARLDWRQDGERYDARLQLAADGLRERVWHSAGTLAAAGLAPERFSDRQRSEQAIHFDRGAGRVVFSNNQPEAALVAGVQDRLSVVLQLAMLVAAEPARFAVGTHVAIPTVGTREAGDWVFRIVGEEDLALPGGTVRALKLERLPRREYDQRLELWLAPGHAYAPVRLRLTNADGGWVDQRWSSTDRG